MRKIHFKSLRTRIWSMLVMLSVAIILLISGIYSFFINNIERSYNEEMLRNAHEMLLGDFANLEVFKNDLDIRSWLRIPHLLILENERGGMSVTTLGKRIPTAPTEIQKVGSELIHIIEENGESQSIEDKVHIFKYQEGDKLREKVYALITTVDIAEEKGYLATYLRLEENNMIHTEVIPIGIAFIIGSFGVAQLIAKSICKPLKKLENHAFKIANQEWVEPLEVDTEDEIGNLIQSINYMQKELKRHDEEQQHFLQSISHDLKTPIMVIEGHAQAIRDGMYIESLDHTAEIIVNESRRLEDKVRKMLYFNTLGYTLERGYREEVVQIDELMKSIVQKFQILSKEMKWQIACSSIQVIANKEQLEVALENILDNQLRYAKSCIAITLYEDDKNVIVDIYNDGDAIEADKIDSVFDHLYKAKHGKFGLGLAITKKIICHYGGSIQVTNHDIEGVTFTITLKKSAS